jgi:hypothetical protein
MRTIFAIVTTTLGSYGGPIRTSARTDAGVARAALRALGNAPVRLCGGVPTRAAWSDMDGVHSVAL